VNSEHSHQLDQESLVVEVKDELVDIDSLELNDHALRYEALHAKLNEALSSIEGM